MIRYFSDIKTILFIVSQIVIIWPSRFTEWILIIIGVLVSLMFIVNVKNLAAKKISAAEFWLNTLYFVAMLLICLIYCLTNQSAR